MRTDFEEQPRTWKIKFTQSEKYLLPKGMNIQPFIREIGRGKDGSRSLTRDQAGELMGIILDGHANELQIGAFCIAMRVKGETQEEMAGFLDAVHARLHYFSAHSGEKPAIVIPSYNGARRLPVLTPLLGLLLAREGFSVLIHGSSTESSRISSQSVLKELGYDQVNSTKTLKSGELVYVHTNVLSPGLEKLLAVRKTIGLRNSAHSIVKLIQPVKSLEGSTGHRPFLVTSYTHPEYAVSMRKTLEITHGNALLLRGCEGEAVADVRRAPAYTVIKEGVTVSELESERGSISTSELFSAELNATNIATYTKEILSGSRPTPQPILDQIELIKSVCQ